jgi:L-asparaginase
VLILHGGAGSAPRPGRRADVQARIRRVLEAAYAELLCSGALAAAVAAVRLLEDDPAFNAGTGARVQSDGRARLSAAVMDGPRARFAGVVNVEGLANPVLAARLLLDEEDRVLAGEGAFRFARERGLPAAAPASAAGAGACDTVGACALDAAGQLACATSTGGKGRERPGRVSDSPMPVATYADALAAVSATGVGEEIMEAGLAVRIATRVRDGLAIGPAFRKTFREVRAAGLRMGAVGLDRKGNLAWDTTTAVLAYGWRKGRRTEIFR